MEEIGDIYNQLDKNDFAEQCYSVAIEQEPNNGILLKKYGNLMLKNRTKVKQVEKAIGLLKRSLDCIEGDNAKNDIALVLQDVLNSQG